MTRNARGAWLALVVVAACGSRTPAPERAGPPPIDPARLARDLRADFVELGAIARRTRDDCPALVAALHAHVARMQPHADQVTRTMQGDDRGLRDRIRIELAKFDHELRSLADGIAADLAATYRTCPDNDAVPAAIGRIPSLP